MKTFNKVFTVLVFIFLYVPMLVLTVASFNKGMDVAVWKGFTFDQYAALFQDGVLLPLLLNSLIVAVVSSLVATVLGTMAALGIHSMSGRMRRLTMAITNIPMTNPDIITGISLMLVFLVIGNFLSRFDRELPFGFWTVLIGHITFNIPYTILSIMPKLRQTSRYTYEAALDLGATPFYAFYKTTLPDLMPGILSGFLLAFTMSLDDFVITHFVKGAGFDTLSTKIYTEVKKGIKPEMYALSTLLFLAVLILLLLSNYRPKRRKKAD